MANRPKGYMDWQPQPHVAAVVEQVRAVLGEYASYGPMTVRQIFYRLVGQYDYPKDEKAYNRLAEYLVKARRAQMINFGRIRDDGTVTHTSSGNEDRSEIWDYITDIVRDPARYYRLDRNIGQPHYVELWCEAAGMAPMLAGMVRQWNIPVYSTGGFSSVTVTYEVAQRVARRDRPTYFLHVGDYDPSGESIFQSMSQDIGAFVIGKFGGKWNPHTGEVTELRGGEPCLFHPRRVALTEEQVDEFDLPTAPPKASDSRSAKWDAEGRETTQAEAMPPTLLEEVVTGYVESELLDHDALVELEQREEDDKERLTSAVTRDSVEDVIADEALADPSLLELVEAIASRDGENR
jgi:hypothetical protein